MDLYDRLALAVGHKPPPIVSLIGRGASYAALIAILALAALPSVRPTADAWLAARGFPGRIPGLDVLAPAYIAHVFLLMGHHRLVDRRAELLSKAAP